MTFVRNFLIAAALSLVVFIPIAYFTVGYVTAEVEKGIDAKTSEPEPTDNAVDSEDHLFPDVSGELSMLLAVTSPENSQSIEFLTLVYYNLNARQVVITALPGDLKVSLKGVDMSLSEACEYQLPEGEPGLPDDYISQVVTACTGVTVDCFGTVGLDAFADVADHLGGLPVEFSEAFTIYDNGTRFFPKGWNQLTAADLHSLLNYKGYSSHNTRLQMITAVCKSVLEKSCTTEGYLALDQTIDHLNARLDAINLGDYESIRDFIPKVFAYKFCTVTELGAQGSYVTVGEEQLFSIDYSNMISQMRQYSK